MVSGRGKAKLIRNIENGYTNSTEGEVEITFRVLNVNIKGVHGQHTLYTFWRHADILNENKKKEKEFSMENIIFKWVIK